MARLPLRLTACQLLDFALLRTASVLAGFQRLFYFFLFARSAFCLLALFLAQFACICHECRLSLLRFFIADCRASPGQADENVRPYVFRAASSWAYFSTSFFKPKRGNCTVILASSPSPSRW